MADSNGHDWAFAAAGVGDTVQAIAICSSCGLIRTETHNAVDPPGRRIDLGGECPDRESEQLEDRLGQV